MCGIAGFVGFRDDDLIVKMTEVLTHRGPDDSGYYVDEGASLGHRRLSIIDLETGRQPIHNEDGTIWIVFNGEIYNYLELKEDLLRRGHRFSTRSDAEVIVHAYEEWGRDCLKKFNGEFALALWDKNKRELFLARDRLGIRPLYYLLTNDRLVFASEIKSILKYPEFKTEVNFQAIDLYLTLRFIPREVSIFKGIEKLPPATYLVFGEGRVSTGSYWELIPQITKGKALSEYVGGFYDLLKDSVKLRLRSDVSLGAHLSGGVDSSSIAYLAQELSGGKLKTFVIAFGTDIDETWASRKVADFLGTDHHELYVTPEDFNLLPRIIWHFDEPLGDPIIIPLYLLARATRKEVKVVLTGEGADEILGGYVHQLTLYYAELYRRKVPSFFDRFLFKPLVKASPLFILDRFFPYPASLGEKGKERLLDFLGFRGNWGQNYLTLTSLYRPVDKKELYTPFFAQLVAEAYPLEKEIEERLKKPSEASFLDRLLLYDISRWLPDNQNFKQDRVTMANALEARVPFLDHRLVEYSFTLPAYLKISRLENKILLRKTFKDKLSSKVAWRKKQPFFIPVEKCFKSGLDDFIRSILSPEAIKKRGYFSYSYVEKILGELEGSALLSNKQLMALVILELWHRIFVDGEISFD